MHFVGIWSHPQFQKIWIAQTISEFGSQVTNIALPLIAVLALKATPTQMGFLQMVEYAPFLLIGLFAGVWIDRFQRRPILIAADLGRAILLCIIPVSAILGTLGRIEELYIVGLFVGILTVFFELALPAYLPSLIKNGDLVQGYGNLEAGLSIAQVTGPAVGGWLVQTITAPFAIIIDVFSYVVSALLLLLIPANQENKTKTEPKSNMHFELLEGLHAVWENLYLRALCLGICTANFFDGSLNAVVMIYLVRTLQIKPVVLGIILAAGSVGSFVGAFSVGKLSSHFGKGPSLILAAILIGLGRILIPLAGGKALLVIWILISSYILTGFGFVVYGVNLKSLSQAVIPNRLLGRVFSTQRFIGWGALSLGLLLGGLSAQIINLQLVLLISAIGIIAAVLWLVFSPVRILHELPNIEEKNIS